MCQPCALHACNPWEDAWSHPDWKQHSSPFTNYFVSGTVKEKLKREYQMENSRTWTHRHLSLDNIWIGSGAILFIGGPALFPTALDCREAHISTPVIVLVVSTVNQSQTKGNARMITSPSCISCSQCREEKQIPEDSFSEITDSIVFKSKHCKQIFYDSPLKKDLYC